jgi:DNA-binding NarL/FixJ family response regulator
MSDSPTSLKRKVFIVDDHPLVREWLTNLINQQPDLVVCGEAGTAPDALCAAPASRAKVAVVDISLNGSSGIELIKDLKKCCPKLVVLVLSMHDESLYAERALRAGAKGYIMKRETAKRVIEGIRTVLQGKYCVSDAIAQSIAAQFVEGKTLAAPSSIAQLSDRELAIFDLLGQGLGTRQIAGALRISIKTVQTHCARIKDKLRLASASQLVREAVRHHDAGCLS